MKYLPPEVYALYAKVPFPMLAAASVLLAVSHLFRLIRCARHKDRKEGCSWFGIYWVPIYLCLLLGLCSEEDYRIAVIPIIICVFAWIFALCCAIIQIKVLSGLTWRKFLEDRMEKLFYTIKKVREAIIKLGNKWASVPWWALLLAVALGVALMVLAICVAPLVAVVLFVVYYVGIFAGFVYRSIESCRNLLFVMFVGGLQFAIVVILIIGGWLQTNVITGPVVYCLYILLQTVFWCLSAGVADYEVAKMACNIINTGTTILLLLFNVSLTWFRYQFFAEQNYDTELSAALFGINVVLLPLVTSGYLTALFVEAQNYFWSRKKKREDDGKKPVEPGSTTKINGKEKQP